MSSIRETIQNILSEFIKDPQLSEIEFMRKNVAFTWTLGSFISVIFLTMLAYLLRANIIGHYGIVLIILYLIEVPFFRKHNFDIYQSIFLAVLIVTTFIFILIFGGYTNSAGLVFVGLTCVMSSLLLNSLRWAFILFFLYVTTIIGLAILDPYLTHHPQVTQGINLTFFILNTIWMSAAMMFFIITYLTERNKYQVAETNRLHELDDVRTQLFTNITHEFRTPITLISGFADELSTGDEKSGRLVRQIKMQSKKLLNLVNQILELSRIDSKTVRVEYIQNNVIPFLNYLIESFSSAAKAKGISFYYNVESSEINMDYDAEKLQTIMVNLISNAIKFTPSGGSIFVNIRKMQKQLEICVQDTGIGISDNNLNKIFEKFYQVRTDKYLEGNGIGLTIIKEYVSLLNGKIEVESHIGEGTNFIITLPITNNAHIQDLEYDDFNSKQDKNYDTTSDEYNGELPLLLIIDDNHDVMEYLKMLLQNRYQVICAANGKEGLQMASEQIPDIIVSDVMMPEMDGIEFLKKVKSEFTTSHIPVLMLTAKTDQKSKLESYGLGAEAYLIKPFDKEELLTRINTLLDLRKKLKERFQNVEYQVKDYSQTKDIEDRFMAKIQEIIEAHLDDETFNIKELCQELAMSHTQLYRKFSALTDLTVNKYIRQFRLLKAMNLLKSNDLNISQVAIEVGMPNLAYFSRVFKEAFGISPSKVRKSTHQAERNA